MIDNEIDSLKRLNTEIIQLVSFQPVFGNIFLGLPKIESETISTMAVGPHQEIDLALFWNSKFVSKLDKFELRAVLIHEAMHILLHHVLRPKYSGYKDQDAWNIAADLSINPYIKGLPEGAQYPEQYKLKPFQTADFYYKNLEGKIPKKNGAQSIDDHSLWEECNSSLIEEKIKQIARESMRVQDEIGWSKIRGTIPQELESLFRVINISSVNWKKVFQYFFIQVALIGKKNTRSKPNRRFGWLVAGKKRDYTSKVLVALDTSGSMADRELQEFINETNKMAEYAEVDMVQFDSELKGEPVPWSPGEIKIKGRGGTSFGPVMELVKNKKYDGLIICTDGEAPFPPKPNIQLLWVLTTRSASKIMPYGKKVVLSLGSSF